MTAIEFRARIKTHRYLRYRGIKDGEIIITNGRAKVHWRLTPRAILDGVWEDIGPVLECKREPDIMTGVTRITGYYSKTKNWNPSKIAELRDRRRGDYAVPEEKRDR